MKNERFWRLAGVTASLMIIVLGLLALNLVARPSEPVHGAEPNPSQGPALAALPAAGTPDPGSALQAFPGGSDTGTCANPIPIACGEQDAGRDSGDHNSDIDDYSCWGWSDTGAEVIYATTLSAGHTWAVTATLSNHVGTDLDVFLLSTTGCITPTAVCLDAGSCGEEEATATNVSPGTYYIAVDGYDGDQGTYTLDVACQALTNQQPNEPGNPSPGHLAVDVDLNPTLSWTGGDPDGDQVLYTVEASKKGELASMLWCQDVPATSCAVGPLEPATNYLWKVYADDQHGGFVSTGLWEFTTETPNQPPNEPSSPSPADKGKKVDRQPVFSWTGGDPDINDTVLYTVTGGLMSSVVSERWCTGTARTICKPPRILEPAQEYYWQVLADDQKGGITWGPAWSFNTRANTKVFLPLVLKAWAPKPPPAKPPTATPTQTNTPPPTSSPKPSNTPPLPAKSGMRFTNYTPYVLISLTINGAEEFPAKPLGLLPNYYMDKELAPGTYQVEVYNGWWQDDGSRFTMYRWYGDVTVLPGQMETVDITGPAIEELLPYFKASRYWQGEIWTGFPVTLHHAGFCFYDNKTFRYYLDGKEDDSGTYAELYRGVGSVTFRVTNTGGTEAFDGVLNELDGSFKMANGTADWRLVEYDPDDKAVCPPAP